MTNMDRRTGRTTRIIDQCVQEFFTQGYTICLDHHPSDRMSEYVLNRVVHRLSSEHGILLWKPKPVIDRKRFIIAVDENKLQEAINAD